jgi:hypothetical protein
MDSYIRWCSWCLPVTRRVSRVLQELFAITKHLTSPLVVRGVRVTRSLVFYVMICWSLFVLFRLAIVLSVLFLLAIVLSVLFLLAIVLYVLFFWPLCCLSLFVWPLFCLSFFELRLLITSLVSANFSCSWPYVIITQQPPPLRGHPLFAN